jgi:hypothetical protein
MSADNTAKKTFRIPLVWQEYGHVDVEAETLEEAIEYALGPECPLPEGSYVDESIEVDYAVLEQDGDKETTNEEGEDEK